MRTQSRALSFLSVRTREGVVNIVTLVSFYVVHNSRILGCRVLHAKSIVMQAQVLQLLAVEHCVRCLALPHWRGDRHILVSLYSTWTKSLVHLIARTASLSTRKPFQDLRVYAHLSFGVWTCHVLETTARWNVQDVWLVNDLVLQHFLALNTLRTLSMLA
jgi:hypothetical protein